MGTTVQQDQYGRPQVPLRDISSASRRATLRVEEELPEVPATSPPSVHRICWAVPEPNALRKAESCSAGCRFFFLQIFFLIKSFPQPSYLFFSFLLHPPQPFYTPCYHFSVLAFSL